MIVKEYEFRNVVNTRLVGIYLGITKDARLELRVPGETGTFIVDASAATYLGERDTDSLVPIEKVKKGDYFRIVGQKDVKVADGYNRSTKKYSYYSFNDINKFGEKKKGTIVEINF